MPEVSVIVPVYNVESYLARCIDSVLSQTFSDWELILIDDGSPDQCGEIIDQYAKRDSKIVAIHQENKGVSAARNAGLERATGEYISFIDPDDYVSEIFLEKLVNAMETGADIACCNWISFTENETKPHEVRNVPERMSRDEWLCHIFDSPITIAGSNWNKLFRRSMIRSLYDETLSLCEDNLFLLQYSLHICKAVYINEALYHVYERTNSAIRQNRSKLVESLPVRYRFIAMVSSAGRPVRQLAEKDYIDTCLLYYDELKMLSPQKSEESKKRLIQYLKQHFIQVMTNEQIYWKAKIMYLAVLASIR